MRRIFFLVLMVVFLVSCSKEDEEDRVVEVNLVYMIADNNLSGSAIDDINEMERGYENVEGQKLLVYVDASGEGELPRTPVLLEVVRDESEEIKSRIVYSYPERNSGEVSVMREVMRDAFGYYPNSRAKGLMLWSHGNAWLPDRYKILGNGKSFGRDEFPKEESMEIGELSKALEGYYFDYIIFDACFMGNVETLYELRERAKYFVVSGTEIMADGFPYEDVVPIINKKEVRVKEIGKVFLESYKKRSGDYGSASVSVVDGRELDGLARFFREKRCVGDVDIEQVQQYSRGGEGYLYDMREIMSKKGIDVGDLWDRVVVFRGNTEKIINMEMREYGGLSVFYKNKNSELNEYYKKTSWYKATGMLGECD